MSTNLKKILAYLALICVITGNWGCEKYLDEKSDQKLVIPSTVEDLQALLDDNLAINQRDPSAAETSADDYYLTDKDWASLNQYERNIYTWEKSGMFRPGNGSDWALCYITIYKSNIVLDNMDRVARVDNNRAVWDITKGNALFLRAKCFLQGAFIWALAYDHNSSATDLGLPLRLDPNFNTSSVRSSVQQTYDQVIADLKAASDLLPIVPLHVLRPSKPAAYALLARTYLSMREYDSAGKYADLCLNLKNELLDYNSPVDPTASFPFAPRFSNPEIIMDFAINGPPNSLSQGRCKIDSFLYANYDENDLRKQLFFKPNTDGSFAFKGSYFGGPVLFDGLSTDEVYLIRAECNARSNKISEAMSDLNALLTKRWLQGTFVPVTANDASDALNKILMERRKELLMRGLRWMDIKRLNKEGANIKLTRIVNGQVYTLEPNNNRYALPIPEDVIAISGMTQNIR